MVVGTRPAFAGVFGAAVPSALSRHPFSPFLRRFFRSSRPYTATWSVCSACPPNCTLPAVGCTGMPRSAFWIPAWAEHRVRAMDRSPSTRSSGCRNRARPPGCRSASNFRYDERCGALIDRGPGTRPCPGSGRAPAAPPCPGRRHAQGQEHDAPLDAAGVRFRTSALSLRSCRKSFSILPAFPCWLVVPRAGPGVRKVACPGASPTAMAQSPFQRGVL